MADMIFTLPGTEVVTLTGQTVDKLLRTGDGEAALLYLYILKTQGQRSSAEAARDLDKSMGAIASAMAVLSRLGLIKCDEASSKAVPPPLKEAREYTPDEITREMQEGSDFKCVVDEAQRKLGKILSPDDLQRLFGIYDSLRLPPEVIFLLFGHCIEESRKKGTGRPPSMRYIEKAAYTWEREGIFSLERAEEYLKALTVKTSARQRIKSALGIRDRELSASEKRYVDAWIELGFEAGAVEIAYDRTVLKTGKLSWGYLDSIIRSWHSKSLFTPEDIITKDGKSKPEPKKEPAAQKFGTPNSEEHERMKKLLQKLKEE